MTINIHLCLLAQFFFEREMFKGVGVKILNHTFYDQ
jgi:hypothetical protein